MAGADRMTIEEVVRKVLADEHADVIREAVKAVAAELMAFKETNGSSAAATSQPSRSLSSSQTQRSPHKIRSSKR